MQKKQRLKYLFQILISLVIAIILVLHLDIRDFIRHLSRISLPVLGVILIFLLPSLLVRAYRWKFLFNDHVHRIKLHESLILLLVGVAFNLALPATSGDIIKSYFGYRWFGVKERMLSISLLDKVIALASIAILGIPIALYQGNLLYGYLSTLVLLPGTILLALPWLSKNVSVFRRLFQAATNILRRKLDFLSVVDEISVRKEKVIYALAISVLGWALTYFQMYLCFRSINVDMSLPYVFAVAPLLTLIRLFPLTLSGIGSDEAALCYFFQQAGASMEEILASALLYRFFVLILPGLIGLCLLAGIKRTRHNRTTE